MMVRVDWQVLTSRRHALCSHYWSDQSMFDAISGGGCIKAFSRKGRAMGFDDSLPPLPSFFSHLLSSVYSHTNFASMALVPKVNYRKISLEHPSGLLNRLTRDQVTEDMAILYFDFANATDSEGRRDVLEEIEDFLVRNGLIALLPFLLMGGSELARRTFAGVNS